MIEAQATITIQRPLTQVFDYTIHPNNAQHWYENVKTSTLTEGQSAPAVGATAQLLTNIMGKDYPFTYEIKTLEPNIKLLMTSIQGAFPMESEYLFKSIDEHNTQVTVINRASPKGIPSFLLSMVKGKVQKTIEESVSTLKKIIESQA